MFFDYLVTINCLGKFSRTKVVKQNLLLLSVVIISLFNYPINSSVVHSVSIEIRNVAFRRVGLFD